MDFIGVTSPRWLGIEMVGGCLFVAYILLGVRGNDDDDEVSGGHGDKRCEGIGIRQVGYNSLLAIG